MYILVSCLLYGEYCIIQHGDKVAHRLFKGNLNLQYLVRRCVKFFAILLIRDIHCLYYCRKRSCADFPKNAVILVELGRKDLAIKTAIIGLGIMGQRMLEQMILHPEFVVDTIWDPDSAACQSAQKLAPDALVASNAEAAFSKVDFHYILPVPLSRARLML